jgi:hypothetical protein
MPLGYAAMVTVDRHILWWRLYVGQCFLAWRCIVCQHAQKILQKSTASLFYYIAWLGNGTFPADTALLPRAYRRRRGLPVRLE